MSARLTPRVGDFDEQAALAALGGEGLQPTHWSNGPGEVYASHSHAYHKVLYCLRGSIRFETGAGGQRFELRPGDRLDVQPGTVHAAVVGPEGVECVEGARDLRAAGKGD